MLTVAEITVIARGPFLPEPLFEYAPSDDPGMTCFQVWRPGADRGTMMALLSLYNLSDADLAIIEAGARARRAELARQAADNNPRPDNALIL